MDILHSGLLREKDSFYIRRLHPEDVTAILRVQQEVLYVLDDPKSLSTLSEEEYAYILSGGGKMVGVFADGRLVAFRALLVPAIDEEHLGHDIELDPTDLASVVYQEISNVLPRYRGYRLQKLMGDILMEQLRKEEFKYVCATVAPYNIASLRDKFAQQMEIAALKRKYGGLLRYVFVKHLHEDAKVYETEQDIPMQNTKLQQKLLAEGWRGTGVSGGPDGWLVRYCK
ncbi:GNAT family N-acetyltransferase [Sporosarcina sp. YIM B06819]|uniref:GNAT family N-acetyltransferase n=1 Tax=Sporosarcina sp. YIM B06819 TaxID=3081769 RepID=UPI00298BF554|nr:GNAT family N-acetyltransferase [Sporosarcina sp. YIM B06819]